MNPADFGTGAARLFAAAALILGWRPDDFWNATPAELATALLPDDAAEGPEAEAIAELMRRFPDERKT